MRSSRLCFLTLVATVIASCAGPAPDTSTEVESDHPTKSVRLQLLAINDFHGQLVGRMKNERREGSAAALATYFRRERAEFDGETIVVQSGDLFGASSPESALLKDEPTMAFFDSLGGDGCKKGPGPGCGLVGTVGNHEFDEGLAELLRMVHGGPSPNGPFLEDPYPGTSSTMVSANVVDARTGEKLFAPWTIRNVGGARIGFTGAVTTTTEQIVRPEMIENIRFLDEATSVNEAVRELKKQDVRVIIVLLHEGGDQKPYDGPTRRDGVNLTGRVTDIVENLDEEVDVVVAGHTHEFHNAFVPGADGKEILVVQALPGGRGYADIELEIDSSNGDVTSSSAVIKRVFADEVAPDTQVGEITAQALERVGPVLAREVCLMASRATRDETPAGESVLGNLVADAQRKAVLAQVAFMNSGGLRADLENGTVTYGQLFAVHPFENLVVAMTLTGAQIAALLQQQWQPDRTRILQVSGLTYTWTMGADGPSVTNIAIDGEGIDSAQEYRIAVNDFLAAGGDGFSVFAKGKNRKNGPSDLEALETYLTTSKGPITPPQLGRINTTTPTHSP